MHTHQTVHDILQDNWESDLPDFVITALIPFDGKPTTTRLLKALPEKYGPWRLRREYGMTHLENEAYRKQDYKHGISLLLFHAETAEILDLGKVKEHSSAYYSARVERNHARMEAMNTKAILDAAAAAMNEAEAAIDRLIAAEKALDSLTGYGELLNPDRYAILKACRLADKDGRPILARDYRGWV